MAYDGTLKFDTGIDTSGFQKGILTLANTAKTGLKAAVTAIAGGTTAVAGIGAAAINAALDCRGSNVPSESYIRSNRRRI